MTRSDTVTYLLKKINELRAKTTTSTITINGMKKKKIKNYDNDETG